MSALISWIYLQLVNLNKLGQGTNASLIQNSSEESVIGSLPILEPVVENKTYPDTSSSMAADSHASIEIPETIYSMAFIVRLAFTCTNVHNAQLCWDPMNRWIVKIEEHPWPLVHHHGSIIKGRCTRGKKMYVNRWFWILRMSTSGANWSPPTTRMRNLCMRNI